MENSNSANAKRTRLANVLTDIQFWVPLAVLIAGLVLLKLIH